MVRKQYILLFVTGLLVLLTACKPEDIKPKADFPDEALGCGSFTVFKVNEKQNEILSVSGNREQIGLSFQEQAFDLSDATQITASIQRFDTIARNVLCTDDENLPLPISTWTATEGVARVAISQDSIFLNPSGSYTYRLNVLLENVRFENSSGRRVNIDLEEFMDVYVAWDLE